MQRAIALFAVVLGIATSVILLPTTDASARGRSSPLQLAGVCYGQGNMACVVGKLENAPLPTEPRQVGEHYRLLAMAAARMDRHQLARTAFAAWIALDPARNKLSKATASPAIYRDYAAAWLELKRASLDLRPRDPPRPAPLPGPVTAGDLPRFSPPARSKRDGASDTSFGLGLSVAPLQGSQRVFWGGGHISLAHRLGKLVSVGFRAALLVRGHAHTLADTRTGIGYLVAAVAAHVAHEGRLSIAAVGGVAATPDAMVGGLAFRYDARNLLGFSRGGRPFVEVLGLYSTQQLVGRPLVSISLGFLVGGAAR